MCGIIGMFGKLEGKHEDVFTNLVIMDSLRGMDSVGIVGVPKTHDKVEIYKKAIDPFTFIDTVAYDKIVKKGFSRFFLGHNRAATRGFVTHENAHPFQHGSITGVHNGTIRNQSLLPDYTRFAVDSDNLIYSISQIGITDTWKKIDGAAAIVWWDEEDNTVHFVRNKERPLWWCQSDKQETVFWASEPTMLASALNRNGVNYKKIVPFKEDRHYSYQIPSINYNSSFNFSGWGVEKLDPFVRPVTKTTVYSSSGGFNREKKKNITGGTSQTSVIKAGEIIPFRLVGSTFQGDTVFINGQMSVSPFHKISIAFNSLAEKQSFPIDYTADYEGAVAHTVLTNNNSNTTVYLDKTTCKTVKKIEEYKRTVKDHMKMDMDQDEFDKRYTRCGDCGAILIFDDAHKYRFVTYLDALCEDCKEKAENHWTKVQNGPF